MHATPVLSCVSNRIAVVRATPSGRATVCGKGVDEPDNRSIGASDHKESSNGDDEDAPANHCDPSGRSTRVRMPVVVEPHDAFRLEAEQSTEKGTDKRDKATEGGNTACNAVGDDGRDGSAAQPGAPVREGVGCQMLGTAEKAKKDVLGRDLLVVSMCA